MGMQMIAGDPVVVDDPGEAQAWLEQIQYPEVFLGNLIVFRKEEGVDVFSLGGAIRILGSRFPDLAARYVFDGDELRRTNGGGREIPIRFIGHSDLDGALEHLVSWVRKQACDGIVHPLIIGIVVVGGDMHVAVLVHDIVARRHVTEDIICRIVDTCGGCRNESIRRLGGAVGATSLVPGFLSRSSSSEGIEARASMSDMTHERQEDGNAHHVLHAASVIHEHRPNSDSEGQGGLVSNILGAFREALNAPDMEADEDFFDRGGHSLIATRVIGSLAEKHGIDVAFNDLFSHPTASLLATVARKHVAEVSVHEQVEVPPRHEAPLALAQMSLWKIYTAFGFGPMLNIPFGLDFLSPVDEQVFQIAFRDIIERHDALRTTFFEREDGQVFQRVVPVDRLDSFKWFWSSEEAAGTSRATEAAWVFDLSKELPLRIRFFVNPDTGRQELSLLFHHIAIDEWSLNIVVDELVKSYHCRSVGEVPSLPAAGRPFLDFALLQSEQGLDRRHLDFWVDDLRDMVPGRQLKIDTGRVLDMDMGLSDGQDGWIEYRFDPEASRELYRLSRECSSSLFHVVYAALVFALSDLTRIDDLIVGTSASGRTDPSFFDTVGYFTTVVAHRIRVDDALSIGEFVAYIRDLINRSLPMSDIPIDLVEEALGMSPGKEHIFDVFIQIHAKNKLNGLLSGPEGERIEFRQIDPDKHESMLGLQFEVMEECVDGQEFMRILMSYRGSTYSAADVGSIRSAVYGVFDQFSRKGAIYRKLTTLRPISD